MAWAKERPDEMDLSRMDRQRRDEEVPQDCPCCEHPPRKQIISGTTFPHRVQCSNENCGIATPWMKLEFLAVLIWNRRPKKPLLDTMAPPVYPATSTNRRSSARAQGTGSQANRPKRMVKKHKRSSK